MFFPMFIIQGELMKSSLTLKITNAIFLFATIIINFLANYLPFNDISTGEVSAAYENPFTPAGFTFSIWGVIYFLLFIFIIYQFKSKKDTKVDFSTGPYFIIASIANCSWLYLWHQQLFLAAMVVILILALSLFQIFKKVEKIERFSTIDYISLKLPFSIYTAWLSVASLANFMVLLVYFKNDWPKNFLTIAAAFCILTALFIAIKILDIYQNIPFALVIIWALSGIISANTGGQDQNMLIIITASISIIIIIFKTAATLLAKNKN